ncbi:MAG TPA: hypothetical protein VG317_03335 [Pseudonocardiaceae bacterium]|nr:hypothetical protein [Pseudonocardiaceae bacterium]
MATKKITISVSEEVLARALELAQRQGLPLSTWIAAATEHEVRIQDGLAALREWDEASGPPSPEATAWAEEQFARIEAELDIVHHKAG